MPTQAEAKSKPLPNGTPGAAISAKLKIRTLTADDIANLPKRFIGKERTPGQFDDLVLRAKESGEGRLIEVGPDEDERKAIVAELHRSAKFHEVGIDVWRTLEDGIAFVTRPKRVRKASE